MASKLDAVTDSFAPGALLEVGLVTERADQFEVR